MQERRQFSDVGTPPSARSDDPFLPGRRFPSDASSASSGGQKAIWPASPAPARMRSGSSFPPDSPLSDLRRASVAASKPPVGRRGYFAPIHWLDVIILLVAVVASWCLGQFAPGPWIDALSLTAARVVVAVIGVIIGIACGYALVLRIGRRIYAATVYATLTHSEMPLHELDKCAEPGPVSALHLLRWRMLHPELKHRHRPYDTRPWSPWVLYFLSLSLLANLGSFLYGRTVVIYTQTVPQTSSFHPIAVLGELSPADLDYALLIAPTFQSPQTAWTYAAPASFYSVPSPASLSFLSNSPNVSRNRTVFFTDSTPALFSGASVGPAASLWQQFLGQNRGSLAEREGADNGDATQLAAVQGDDAIRQRAPIPVAVDYPVWGTEVRCASLEEAAATVVVNANGSTQWAVPMSAVEALMTDLGVPTDLLDTSGVGTTQNVINAPPVPGDGVTMTFNASVLDMGASGAGFVTLEHILVRVDLAQAPLSRFFTTAAIANASTTVGVDGAVCVSHISPFVVRTIDAAGVTTLMEIVTGGATLPTLNPPATSGTPLLADLPTQPLTSANKSTAFLNAYGSARNNLMKDNGPSFTLQGLPSLYPPNPTVVQMTNISQAVDTMPLSYGVLDSAAVELVLAGAQARFLLPYLVGQGRVAGRAYPYASVAYAYVKTGYLALFMGVILFLGLLGSFFVPRPPFNLPLRELNVSNWLAFADQVPERMLRDEEASVDGHVKLRYGK